MGKLEVNRLRKRQVEVLTRALGQFVALKSSAEGWESVAPLPVDSQMEMGSSGLGGDVSVQMSKRSMACADGTGKQSDVYRMTAAVPLDAGVSRDTQGPFAAYLSELRDWQAVLECPGIRSKWNYFLSSSSTLEMLDAHTSITRSVLQSPVPGRTKEFAHQRDLLMVETSLVDPTTVVYVSTSLPTTPDDPAYLRENLPVKRVHTDLWAWCVEIVTPVDAMQSSVPARQRREDGSSNVVVEGPYPRSRKPRVCVQVTCFMHLELGSWRSQNALACSAAGYLIPSLVAHLRVNGAPPRLARIGPSISVDRRDWSRRNGNSNTQDTPTWTVSYTVMASGASSDSSRSGSEQPTAQPIIARILDLEAASTTAAAKSLPAHVRKESSLSSYLSSSLRRRQGETAAALGTHGGGILRDGEELAVVATRAQLGDSMVEFVVDASRWHSEGYAVDIQLALSGVGSIQQLHSSVVWAQTAAPELFTGAQLGFSLDEFLAQHSINSPLVIANGPRSRCGSIDSYCSQTQQQHTGSRADRAEAWEKAAVAGLAARQLVRCFSIASQQSTHKRYLVRILNPPPAPTPGNSEAADGCPSTALDRLYGVAVSVRKCAQSREAEAVAVAVNGYAVDIAPFLLDLTTAAPRSGDQQPRVAAALLPQPKPVAAAAPLAVDIPASTPPRLLTEADDGSDTLQAEASGRGSGTPASAEDEDADAMQAVPLMRLWQVWQVPAAEWKAVGAARADGVALSRATVSSGESGAAGSGSGSGSCSSSARTMDGVVLRAEALVEGWTVFDVFCALAGGAAWGSWAETRAVEHLAGGAAVWRHRAAATWATAERFAVVCRAWRSNQRSRIDVAESSLGASSVAEGSAVRVDVGLGAWVLEKAENRHGSGGGGGGGGHDVRQRSESVTGSPALDAEVANQRRKQSVVRVTHFVQTRRRGWLDAGDGVAELVAGALETAAMAAAARGITRIAQHLDAFGARPAAVWTRNARVVGTCETADGELIRYRVADGGGGEFVEAEIRIEHRVWTRGAGVSVAVAPFTGASRVACFVDPEADPHATRVRIRHARASLLAWPVVHVTVSRAAESPCARAAASASASSVPPRVAVNGAVARVRYLRRDDAARGFYARCQSVADRDELARMKRPAPAGATDALAAGDAEALAARRCSSPAPHAEGSPALAIQRYSVAATTQPPRLLTPVQFVRAAARVFADIRHDLERLDAQSPRSRWAQQRRPEPPPPHAWRECGAGVFERRLAHVHGAIPVTVAVGVVQGAGAEHVARLLDDAGERARWDAVLFGARREVERVRGEGGVAVAHAAVRVPPLCGARDALTVWRVEQDAFLPPRQRLRNWQQPRAPRGACRAGAGDYQDAAYTLVEASVPGAQPLASATRAAVALYAVRAEPIDAFERVSGRVFAPHACRVTVACCVDVAGSLPLAVRRALSARVPALHIAALRARLQPTASPGPPLSSPPPPGSLPLLGPRLAAPSRRARLMPVRAGRRVCVAAEALAEAVDGRAVLFYRSFAHAAVASEPSSLPGAAYAAAVTLASAPALRDAAAHHAQAARIGDGLPLSTALVVCDVVVDVRCYLPRGYDVSVAADGMPPACEEHAAAEVPCGAWLSPAALGAHRLAVYVFAADPLTHLIRTVLLPVAASDSDDDDDDDVLLAPANGYALGRGVPDCGQPDAPPPVACTVAIRAAAEAASAGATLPPVRCNGQLMRVHPALPPRQSLLFVAADDEAGGVLCVCRECGNVACAADDDSRGLPPLVAFASDDDDDDDDDSDESSPPPSSADEDETAAADPANRCEPSSFGARRVLSTSCSESAVSTQRCTSETDVAGLHSVLRRRTAALGPAAPPAPAMAASRHDANCAAAVPSPPKPRAPLSGANSPTGGRSFCAVLLSVLARAALILLMAPVFLPLRRLAVGSTTVELWLLAQCNPLPPSTVGGGGSSHHKKSVLALVLVLSMGVLCFQLGSFVFYCCQRAV